MSVVAIKKRELMTVSSFSEKIAISLYSMKMYIVLRTNFTKRISFQRGVKITTSSSSEIKKSVFLNYEKIALGCSVSGNECTVAQTSN